MASLAMREHSRSELARKLETKLSGHGNIAAQAASLPSHQQRVLIEAVLDRLEELELLSDVRFAESFVRSRIAKGQGPLKIQGALRERGVKESIVRAQLDLDTEFWLEQAEAARAKRFGPRRDLCAPEGSGESAMRKDLWGRQARFLAQRGFPSSLVYRLLETIQ